MGAIDMKTKRGLISVIAFLVSFFAVASSSAKAEDYAVTQAYVHSFSNSVSVYSGVFALNRDFNLDTSGYFKYTVDLINPTLSLGEGGGGGGRGDDSLHSVAAASGASSAISSGGSSGASDVRNDLTAGITHNFSNIIGVEAYYDYSREKDYTSNTPTLTIKKDLFEKNTTLTLGVSRNMDSIKGKFVDSAKSRDTNNFFAGITQVLTPTTVAQVGYSLSNSSGFESEGIRLVPLGGVDASTCTDKSATCVDENFPDKRTRQSYMFGINQYLKSDILSAFNRASIKFNFRYYTDDWDIRSYTGEVEYNKYLTDQTLLRLNYRYYTQTRAFFVKDTYNGTELYKSASPQLQKFNTNLVGAKLTYRIGDESTSGGKAGGLRVGYVEGMYEYYTESIGVNAHVLMAGLRLLF